MLPQESLAVKLPLNAVHDAYGDKWRQRQRSSDVKVVSKTADRSFDSLPHRRFTHRRKYSRVTHGIPNGVRESRYDTCD